MKPNENLLPTGDAGSVVDRAYYYLREAILSNRYEPGEPLRLSRLAEATGASYIPVREALRRLQAENLVEFTTNKGARVTPISLTDVREIYDLRRLLESEALRQSHRMISSAEIDRARQLVDQMTDAFAADDDRRGFDLHREVHFTFYRPAGSAWLLRLIDLLWANAERHLRRSPGLRAHPEDFGAEHRRFVDLAAENAVEGAASALREHLLHTEKLLIEAYDGLREISVADR